MFELTFEVPGEPKGKARARTVKMKNGKTMSYTPIDTVVYENLVKLCYEEQSKIYKKQYFEGAVGMRIEAFFATPKSTSKTKRADMLRGVIRPTKKPDGDNIIKAIADSLNGVAYKDDSQIVSVECRKWYAEAKPHVKVTLYDVAGEEEYARQVNDITE